MRNLPLPKYQPELSSTEDQDKTQIESKPKQKKWHCITLVICGILSIVLTNGIDITFQSQIYIYGLCGPLDLSPEYAGWLNTLYYANYMIGRLISIPLSTIVSPTVMIFISIIGCLINAIVIVTFADFNSVILFTATSFMAFHVCFLFPSTVTWITSNIENVTSKQISIVLLGSPIASSIYPSLTAKLFNDFGPIYVFYTTIICAVLQLLNFSFMNFIASKKPAT